MQNRLHKDSGSPVQQYSQTRAKQLIREWCEQVYEQMMAEIAVPETLLEKKEGSGEGTPASNRRSSL